MLNTDDGPQIFVKPMPDGLHTRLTFENWSARPVWSPDGREVLYIGFRVDSPPVAVRKRPDVTNTATVIAEDPRAVSEILLSPDGEWLVYRTASSTPGAGDIVGRRVTGDTTTISLIASPAQETEPAFSPDGRWLAYVSDEGGREEVFVRPWPDLNAGRWRVSTQGGTEPQWSPDGTELFYRSGRQKFMAARVETTPAFRVTGSQSLFSSSTFLSGGQHAAYAVSPDGRRFLFGRQDITGATGTTKLILARNWLTELRSLLNDH